MDTLSSGVGAFSDFLGGLYDSAKGVFNDLADFELSRAELELEKERREQQLRELQGTGGMVTADENGGVQLTNGGVMGSGLSQQSVLLIGGAALLVLLLVMRR